MPVRRHLLASLLLAALGAWLPTSAACPAEPIAPGCELRAGPEGIGAAATVADTELVAQARPPLGLAPGEDAAYVSVWRLREPFEDEAALVVSAGCPVVGEDAFCSPTNVFAGASAAQAGQWAGVGTRTEWRSVGMWYEGDVAGREIVVRGNTFQYDQLRRGSMEVWVNGFGTAQNGAFPIPV